MVKSCCAVGCCNRYYKGCGLSFYRFPKDEDRRIMWIASVQRKDWEPNEYSWLCSAHFVIGKKCKDKFSPDYVPTIFTHTVSPLKRKARVNLERYERRKKSKRTRLTDKTIRETVTVADDEANLDLGSKEVYTQTDEVVTKHLSTMTDVSMEYVEALEKECMKSTNSRLEII